MVSPGWPVLGGQPWVASPGWSVQSWVGSPGWSTPGGQPWVGSSGGQLAFHRFLSVPSRTPSAGDGPADVPQQVVPPRLNLFGTILNTARNASPR